MSRRASSRRTAVDANTRLRLWDGRRRRFHAGRDGTARDL